MARFMSSTELFQKLEEDKDMVVIDLMPADEFLREHILVQSISRWTNWE